MSRTLRAAILLGLVLGACVGPLHPSVERAELVADRAAGLRMPGADELRHFAREREFTVEGPAFAFDRRLFGTQAAMEDVFAFYEREFAALGWTRDDLVAVQSTTDMASRGWCKPRMGFRLAIKDPSDHERWIAGTGKTFRTIFDAGLIAREAEARCGRR